MDLILDCQNVIFSREGNIVLCDINIKMKRGDVLLIKGKNGVGKTTLLRIIAKLQDPSSGSVVCSASIAYLGHKNACRDYYTVEENLQFYSKMKNNPELILPTMHLFNLLMLKDVAYKHLSSGYKKKVAIAKMVILDADIWILDEPFANLDAENQKFLSLLIASKAQSGAVIFSGHEREFDIENMQVLEI